MVSEIVVDVGINEKRVALLEDRELVELFNQSHVQGGH